ncbi:MAG: hypothetical protein A3B74_02205 [Candidatus Kerfeldbacteria bacterium RIFCSPHIGHO2_02_FULL_42_14]|uniref:4Fe-4S ferredoxin-type domain-containing protein n=1 Tax=Candidatus Kerfeldbacteria bacterium RIFCSPHIGHO2_02_FULL_42_14 TaxID=1798540 RepID=A0A1G2ARN1_9BACT|nr:MAG: hypothetical protein A3B74_02205 [Candidatus Kerfeldbacteria bacterium RIFCSPHIGHO2_02_FULL_42_14]OGY80362.1 MAG: hypothetical protein A3E60_04825 [Candidatus Kerfeldbacteria bacterium RIFCSPHIGHO2_12_FULL_42_13]OGY83791.1 MAG: hypothetical protein A3I91_04350 [Candidatus Kerfeldbacteria bacterium RIFCSPLOWO2_02_FULL_42_19]OGY87142.1 MAG: hypothetical protein A3G01_04660 [Candidatus Kerfeldbacteria bacterium RIFCSPLOWO2_12_FULL_43_9]
MKRYKIVYDRQNCIGAGPCAAVSPTHWYLDNERKAHIVGGQRNETTLEETVECDESELSVHMNAAVSCPVNVIHIHDQKIKKQLI